MIITQCSFVKLIMAAVTSGKLPQASSVHPQPAIRPQIAARPESTVPPQPLAVESDVPFKDPASSELKPTVNTNPNSEDCYFYFYSTCSKVGQVLCQ